MGDDMEAAVDALMSAVRRSPHLTSELVQSISDQRYRSVRTQATTPRATGRTLLRVGRGLVLQSEDLEDNTAFVRENGRLVEVLVNSETWTTLSASQAAQVEFMKDMTREGKAMGLQTFVTDSGYYSTALRARAKQEAAAQLPTKDRVDVLGETLNSLIIQAASLNDRATRGQMENFSVRYAEAAEQFTDLERRMAELKDLLGLAATAVFEAA